MRKLIIPALFIMVAACGGSSDPNAGEPSVTDAVTSDPVADEPEPTESTAPSTDAPAPTTPAVAETAPAQWISSDDGVVELDVPVGAVPAGTEISITAIDPPDGAESAYEFEPDGLQFAEAATLHWNIEQVPVTLPAEVTTRFIALETDDDDFEPVEAIDAASTDDGYRLSANIEHFSTYTLRNGDTVEVTQTSPTGDVLVGATFEFAVAVHAPDGSPVDFRYDLLPGETLERICEAPVPLAGFLPLNFSPRPQRRFNLEIPVIVDAEVIANCVKPPQPATLSELTLLPSGGDDEPLTGPVFMRAGDDGAAEIGFPLDHVPPGGVMGLYIEGTVPDTQSGRLVFAFCSIERRASQTSSCAIFGPAGLAETVVDIEESVEGERIWMLIPDDFFDLSAGTMGQDHFELDYIGIDRFDEAGNGTHARLDPDEMKKVLARPDE